MQRGLAWTGLMADRAGMPYANELVAYDLGAVLAEVARSDEPEVEHLLEIVLGIQSDRAGADGMRLSPTMLKARLQLLAGLTALERESLATRVEQSLRGVPSEQLQAAAQTLLAAEDPVYREVTDRQRDLDWVPPARRKSIMEAVERLSRSGA